METEILHRIETALGKLQVDVAVIKNQMSHLVTKEECQNKCSKSSALSKIPTHVWVKILLGVVTILSSALGYKIVF